MSDWIAIRLIPSAQKKKWRIISVDYREQDKPLTFRRNREGMRQAKAILKEKEKRNGGS